MAKRKGNTYTCFCCGEQKIASDFYISHSPLYINNPNSKRMTICKECVISVYNEYEKKYKNQQVALFKLTSVLDVYFDIKIVDKVIESKAENNLDTSIAQLYLTKINSLPQYKNKNSLDNQDHDLILGRLGTNEDGEVVDTAIEILEDEVVTSDMIKRWGEGLSKADYLYLEEKYNELAKVYDTRTPAQRWLYESIAMSYLEANNARKKGNLDMYRKLLDSISKMMKDCDITPNSDNLLSEDDNACFGNFIRAIEDEEPVPEPLPFFADVDNFRKYIDEWFVKPLNRVLDLSSDKVKPSNIEEDTEPKYDEYESSLSEGEDNDN